MENRTFRTYCSVTFGLLLVFLGHSRLEAGEERSTTIDDTVRGDNITAEKIVSSLRRHLTRANSKRHSRKLMTPQICRRIWGVGLTNVRNAITTRMAPPIESAIVAIESPTPNAKPLTTKQATPQRPTTMASALATVVDFKVGDIWETRGFPS